ncbi:hypothetical protein GALL_408740 [mine drainage metagenome]|uniref:Uncharacterized protein n=1 Tax=mine drainage metagenome TaxID=410659 RepID=A0A1J5QBS9_9ZZZZ
MEPGALQPLAQRAGCRVAAQAQRRLRRRVVLRDQPFHVEHDELLGDAAEQPAAALRGLCRPALHPGAERFGRHRPGDAVALRQRHAQRAQGVDDVLGLGPLGDEVDTEAARELGQALHEAQVLRLVGKAADEALVELDDVDRQLLDAQQRRIRAADVVQGDATTERAQLGERVLRAAQRQEVAVLEDLQHDALGRERQLGDDLAHRGERFARGQQQRVDVDRDRDLDAVLALPQLRVADGTTQHRDRHRRLRVAAEQRNEIGRTDQPAIAVVEPRQRLDFDDTATEGVDHRLVHHAQPAGGEALAHQPEVAEMVTVDRRLVQAPERRSGQPRLLLDRVQSLVGVAQQFVGLAAVVGVDGQPQAGAHLHHRLAAGQRHVGVDRAANALQRRRDVVARSQPLQHDDDLVAAEPRDGVGRAHRLDQPCRHRAQQRVAGGVTVAVVDLLEIVEIENAHGDVAALRVDLRQRLLEPQVQPAAIEQAGQRVMLGQPRDVAMLLLQPTAQVERVHAVADQPRDALDQLDHRRREHADFVARRAEHGPAMSAAQHRRDRRRTQAGGARAGVQRGECRFVEVVVAHLQLAAVPDQSGQAAASVGAEHVGPVPALVDRRRAGLGQQVQPPLLAGTADQHAAEQAAGGQTFARLLQHFAQVGGVEHQLFLGQQRSVKTVGARVLQLLRVARAGVGRQPGVMGDRPRSVANRRQVQRVPEFAAVDAPVAQLDLAAAPVAQCVADHRARRIVVRAAGRGLQEAAVAPQCLLFGVAGHARERGVDVDQRLRRVVHVDQRDGDLGGVERGLQQLQRLAAAQHVADAAHAPELEAEHLVQVPDQALHRGLLEEPRPSTVQREQVAPAVGAEQRKADDAAPAGACAAFALRLGAHVAGPVDDDLRQPAAPGQRGRPAAVQIELDAAQELVHAVAADRAQHQRAVVVGVAQPDSVQARALEQKAQQLRLQRRLVVGGQQQQVELVGQFDRRRSAGRGRARGFGGLHGA